MHLCIPPSSSTLSPYFPAYILTNKEGSVLHGTKSTYSIYTTTTHVLRLVKWRYYAFTCENIIITYENLFEIFTIVMSTVFGLVGLLFLLFCRLGLVLILCESVAWLAGQLSIKVFREKFCYEFLSRSNQERHLVHNVWACRFHVLFEMIVSEVVLCIRPSETTRLFHKGIKPHKII